MKNSENYVSNKPKISNLSGGTKDVSNFLLFQKKNQQKVEIDELYLFKCLRIQQIPPPHINQSWIGFFSIPSMSLVYLMNLLKAHMYSLVSTHMVRSNRDLSFWLQNKKHPSSIMYSYCPGDTFKKFVTTQLPKSNFGMLISILSRMLIK
ncbi:hypothetical protein BpHYR1_009207 [Brachionus plicatilis]|uniref:Uncharacterized protein n=1 Tax=Brachionus plicatilis TaxID=10195 RepID=A0A3M7PTS1_BRAPC|nr:hypothetical protein BpHYR1_009207 [Brachionus plicatilis]